MKLPDVLLEAIADYFDEIDLVPFRLSLEQFIQQRERKAFKAARAQAGACMFNIFKDWDDYLTSEDYDQTEKN